MGQTVHCGFITTSGTPCKNPVNLDSTHCSAGHPLDQIYERLTENPEVVGVASAAPTVNLDELYAIDERRKAALGWLLHPTVNVDELYVTGHPFRPGPAVTTEAGLSVTLERRRYPDIMNPEAKMFDGGIDQWGNSYVAFTGPSGRVAILTERLEDDTDPEFPPEKYPGIFLLTEDEAEVIVPTDSSMNARLATFQAVNKINHGRHRSNMEALVHAGIFAETVYTSHEVYEFGSAALRSFTAALDEGDIY